MSPSHSAHQRARKRTSMRAIVWWSVAGVVVLLVACVAWIGIRALSAKADLEASVGLVSQIKTQISDGNVKAVEDASRQLTNKVHSARDLTSDLIWRAGEILPLAGPNLTAVREASAVVSNVTDRSITPLAGLAGSLNLASFKPVNGAIPLQPLVAAAPTVLKANAELQAGLQKAQNIDTTRTISPVNSSVKQLVNTLQGAAQLTDAASRAVELVPSMLGEAGPRNYLVLFQNNAELRATGGISGALALVHVENGAISMTQQASSRDFPHYDSPVLPLPATTAGIYGNISGEYIQDVNLPPQYPMAAKLAQEMWKRQYGTQVDGVLALDPVALSYLLKATGPVTLPTGDVLSSKNAVKVLLSDAYARYSVPAEQDAFFASAAAKVFNTFAAGKLNPKAMIHALAKAAGEHRVLIWSAHDAEQKSLEGTTLAGALPTSSADVQRFGVYLDDATGAKMDYYLHASVALAQATCRTDGRPNYAVEVTLRSAAPANAATALPPYVTGAGSFGVAPGNVRTRVAVYAPPGATFIGATSAGKDYPLHSATDDKRELGMYEVELAPGQSATVELQFLGAQKFSGELVAQTTPGVNVTERHRLALDCTSALR